MIWNPLEPAHLIQLLPLALLAVLPGKRLAEHWWIAAGWAMTWPEDAYASYHKGSWAAFYPLFALELWCVLCALLPGWRDRTLAGVCLAALACFSFAVSMPGTDVILTLVGGAAVWALASADRRFAVPLTLYFVGGGVFRLVAYLWINELPEFMVPWGVSQGFRVAGYASFLYLARQGEADVAH